MLRIVSAEIRYSVLPILVFFGFFLLIGLAPFYSEPSPGTLQGGAALMFIYLPIFSVVITLILLGIEQSEKRLRLFNMLPVSRMRLATARLARPLIAPLLALIASVILLGISFTFAGPELLGSSPKLWLFITLLFAGIIPVILVTLLHDIGGMTFTFALVASFALFGVPLVLLIPDPSQAVLEPLAHLAQTPLGALLALALCVLLGAADIAVFSKRSGVR
jgi:hypothetical protein